MGCDHETCMRGHLKIHMETMSLFTHIYQMPGTSSKIFRPLSVEQLGRVPLPPRVPRTPPNCRHGAGAELPKLPADAWKVMSHNVAGDGNCLYRTASYVFTGSEAYYPQYRAVRKNHIALHMQHMLYVLLDMSGAASVVFIVLFAGHVPNPSGSSAPI